MKTVSSLLIFSALLVYPTIGLAYPEEPPAYVTTWGGPGSGPGQFNGLAKLAVDSQGNVFATDPGNNRVQVFSNSGIFLMSWGDSGCADGQLMAPRAIDIDAFDNVYVTGWFGHSSIPDSCDASIQKFTTNGQFIDRWAEQGPGAGQIDGPLGITVDTDGFVYVTEYNINNRIQKFASDGASLLTWRETPPLVNPLGIAFHPNGNLIATDGGSSVTGHRVIVFSTFGWLLQTYAQGMGSGPGQFNQPSGVAVDASGNIYVADRGNKRVQKLAPDGTLLTIWGTTGPQGPGKFSFVWDVAVDAAGNIFVFDESSRIHKFAGPTSTVPEAGNRIHLKAFPNPFSGSTEVRWSAAPGSLDPSNRVSVTVMDIAGRLVRTLTPGAGSNRLVWDGRDAVGRETGSGVFYLRLDGAGLPSSLKVVRLP